MEGKPYDQSVDLWAVGCILYELAVGKTPFATGDLARSVKNDLFNVAYVTFWVYTN